jgi:hypothetical protein
MMDRKHRYGAMFPDLGRLDCNRPSTGEAFEVPVESHGLGVAARRVKVRPDGWDACTACENDRDCYDVSKAVLTLAAAVAART